MALHNWPKSRLSNLDQMPLTRAALAQISRKTAKKEEPRASPLGNGLTFEAMPVVVILPFLLKLRRILK